MFLNKHYLGLLDLGNSWTVFLVVKHIFVAILIIVGVYMFEVLAPKLGQMASKGPSPELARLQKLQARIGTAGVITALIVLLFTAIISAISALP
jgi:hypothetical protein